MEKGMLGNRDMLDHKGSWGPWRDQSLSIWTGLKLQSTIIAFVFSEGNAGGSVKGKGSCNWVPVSLSGNDDVRTKAQGSDRNVKDGSEVTYVKMRTKAWPPEPSCQRRKVNQLSPCLQKWLFVFIPY